MNHVIERYIYDVARRLPENERGDVGRELRANIEDMLSDDPKEEEIVHVLETLGEPRKLAEQYRANPRYLISPAMFDQYVATVKIILPIVTVGMGLLGLVFDLAEAPSISPLEAFVSVLQNGFSAAVTALFTATLGFALAEHFQFRGEQRKWSPRDLPEIPPEASVRISRGETVASMVFSAAFIAFVFAAMRNPNVIAWYESQNMTITAIPLFMAEGLFLYLPWFVFVSAFSLVVCTIKLILGRWNYLLALINSIYGVAGAIVFILFLNDAGTFNPAIAARIQEVLALTSDQLQSYGQINLSICTALIALFTVLDIGMGWHKARKGVHSR